MVSSQLVLSSRRSSFHNIHLRTLPPHLFLKKCFLPHDYLTQSNPHELDPTQQSFITLQHVVFHISFTAAIFNSPLNHSIEAKHPIMIKARFNIKLEDISDVFSPIIVPTERQYNKEIMKTSQ